jgi:hypothetical protein
MATINPNPRREFDHVYVICPYCGETYGDCWEWVQEYANEMTCEDCGGVFTYCAEHSVAYITDPVSPPPPIVIVPDENIVADVDIGVVEGIVDGVGDVVTVVGDIASGIADAISDALDI